MEKDKSPYRLILKTRRQNPNRQEKIFLHKNEYDFLLKEIPHRENNINKSQLILVDNNIIQGKRFKMDSFQKTKELITQLLIQYTHDTRKLNSQ